jgi:hypothetical protein
MVSFGRRTGLRDKDSLAAFQLKKLTFKSPSREAVLRNECPLRETGFFLVRSVGRDCGGEENVFAVAGKEEGGLFGRGVTQGIPAVVLGVEVTFSLYLRLALSQVPRLFVVLIGAEHLEVVILNT